ncbi:MAG: CBS domain-containing protein [Planctomycetota bacterium]
MALQSVKDIMLPLDDYAVVDEEATMLHALHALDEAQKRLPPGRQPHRAVLVTDKNGHIVGKLGHLAFLSALEPRYDEMGDLKTLSRVGMSAEFITSMMDSLRLWKEEVNTYVRRARNTKVKDAMHPVTENIDENATIGEAIHRILMYQTLSLLVTRGDRVVGILRLSDLFSAVTGLIKARAAREGTS